VKFGKDTQKKNQRQFQKEVEESGGVYRIIRTYDEFMQWYAIRRGAQILTKDLNAWK